MHDFLELDPAAQNINLRTSFVLRNQHGKEVLTGHALEIVREVGSKDLHAAMTISLRTHKILWGWSGGKCALCKNDLIIDPTGLKDAESVVGDEAHIIARKESFTRGDYDSLSADERDQYPNLILLCKVHHKQIDDQPDFFTDRAPVPWSKEIQDNSTLA